MSTSATLLAVIAMGVITFILRAFPTIVPKKLLQSPLLLALNFALPISVMMVLILTSLSLKGNIDLLRIISEVLALLVVLLTYIQWRNVFVSVIIGVAALNGFIWLTSIIIIRLY